MHIFRLIVVAFEKWEQEVDKKEAVDNPVYNLPVLGIFIIKT